jgi:two-component system, chemotaxis family, response regulator PixH
LKIDSLPTLLIVEDSPSELELMSYYLANDAYKVITASSGQEALEIALAKKPTVIVTDVIMPGINGFELCRILKKNPETKNCLIIICSSKNMEIDRLWGIKQGADAYITKPYTREHLLKVIKSLLE